MASFSTLTLLTTFSTTPKSRCEMYVAGRRLLPRFKDIGSLKPEDLIFVKQTTELTDAQKAGLELNQLVLIEGHSRNFDANWKFGVVTASDHDSAEYTVKVLDIACAKVVAPKGTDKFKKALAVLGLVNMERLHGRGSGKQVNGVFDFAKAKHELSEDTMAKLMAARVEAPVHAQLPIEDVSEAESEAVPEPGPSRKAVKAPAAKADKPRTVRIVAKASKQGAH